MKHCDKHDIDYATREESFGDLKFTIGVCPECDKESDAKREAEKIAIAEESRLNTLSHMGISKRFMDKGFEDYIAKNDKAKHNLASLTRWHKTKHNLILVGGVGTGKTHLGVGLLKDFYNKTRQRGEMITAINMVRNFKDSWNGDYSERDVIQHFARLPLLVIDEVGTQFGSDTEKLFFFDVIDGRYQNLLPTVIISNLNMDGLKDVLGERCVDRLREDGGKVLAFDWESARGNV